MLVAYIFGYISFFFMGVILGLIGGGGSMLAVPILVYLMNVPATSATSYSLFVVGLTAVFGSISFYKKNLVDVRAATLFSIPSVAVVYLVRAFLMPKIPEILLREPIFITRDRVIMALFAFLMLVAAFVMMQNDKKFSLRTNKKNKNFLLVIEGIIVGFATGILGAGGGFLIVPALVIFMNIPIKEAIGVSLFVVSAKSIAGFIGDLSVGVKLDVMLLSSIVLFTFSGILTSSLFVTQINCSKLKILFAYFNVCLAASIVIKEFWF